MSNCNIMWTTILDGLAYYLAFSYEYNKTYNPETPKQNGLIPNFHIILAEKMQESRYKEKTKSIEGLFRPRQSNQQLGMHPKVKE